MRNSFILGLLLILCWNSGLAQPYGGTIFVDPDIILPTDSSTLESVTYTGRGMRTVFDRRVNAWVSVNGFLFEVNWNDGLTAEAIINPEFGDQATAQVEAETYGWFIGQLPTCLRRDVDEIWVHRGVQPFGGGNRSILIHTGQSTLYQNDGILEETLVHEASHTSLDADHAQSAGWLAAQSLDGQFISDYAEEFPLREDIAESFLLWLAVRHRADRISAADVDLITGAIPNRLAYFDTIACDLFPIVDETTPIPEPTVAAGEVLLYPNPVRDRLWVQATSEAPIAFSLYTARGELVLRSRTDRARPLDLSTLPTGLYLLVQEGSRGLIAQKLLKQ